MKIVLKNYKLLSLAKHKELLAIRNLAHIRKMSKNEGEIALDEHLKWVANGGGVAAYILL